MKIPSGIRCGVGKRKNEITSIKKATRNVSSSFPRNPFGGEHPALGDSAFRRANYPSVLLTQASDVRLG